LIFRLKSDILKVINDYFMAEKARISLKIHGRVQGVFFRIETKKQADVLDLTGWVKNNNDGSVRCLIEGDKDKLEKLINWCKIGSDSAKVNNIEVEWLPYQGEFKELVIS
jgi:acylphosphatase